MKMIKIRGLSRTFHTTFEKACQLDYVNSACWPACPCAYWSRTATVTFYAQLLSGESVFFFFFFFFFSCARSYVIQLHLLGCSLHLTGSKLKEMVQ